MRRQESSLNPYAASYVPLSRRETGASGGTSATRGSNNYDGTVWYQTPQDTSVRSLSPVIINPASSYYISPSQSETQLTDKQSMDEDRDIDLEYLRLTFPGIAVQSLVDVYTVCHGDIDAAIDMLSQLEIEPHASVLDDAVESHVNLPDTLDIGASLPDDAVEPHLNLPDTLDIGDVSDSLPKQKNVAAVASTSSGHLASSKFL